MGEVMENLRATYDGKKQVLDVRCDDLEQSLYLLEYKTYENSRFKLLEPRGKSWKWIKETEDAEDIRKVVLHKQTLNAENGSFDSEEVADCSVEQINNATFYTTYDTTTGDYFLNFESIEENELYLLIYNFDDENYAETEVIRPELSNFTHSFKPKMIGKCRIELVKIGQNPLCGINPELIKLGEAVITIRNATKL